jgi:hypothetical protein
MNTDHNHHLPSDEASEDYAKTTKKHRARALELMEEICPDFASLLPVFLTIVRMKRDFKADQCHLLFGAYSTKESARKAGVAKLEKDLCVLALSYYLGGTPLTGGLCEGLWVAHRLGSQAPKTQEDLEAQKDSQAELKSRVEARHTALQTQAQRYNRARRRALDAGRDDRGGRQKTVDPYSHPNADKRKARPILTIKEKIRRYREAQADASRSAIARACKA